MALAMLGMGSPAHAGIAYGSINNFDTVNDTGHECHGFEIELEDCSSTDITYTFDYNHYGTPKISQDDSVAGHPRCSIRWESRKNADGSWAAYTAIPSGPINPTDGHSFTNPYINFGGEHFGVGYRVPPSAVRYHWLIDNGSGVLVNGGDVQVATPVFTYYPPVAGAVPAQVQAEIRPPEPPEVHVKEFGDPVWMKEIRTTSHNNNKVELRALLSDDPDDADDKNWRNGEPDEVETEWQLLQTEFNQVDGGLNGKKQAAAEDLDQGDEVVTRRYEFYKYTGPIDEESGEALCDNVGPDDIHGAGIKNINGVDVDFSSVEVVGEYTGAQMAAVDVDAPVGLIEHVNEGKANEEYAARSIVVQGANPFSCTKDGPLPNGMSFDTVTGVLSGTPTASGQFQFKVTANDGVNPEITKTYILAIAAGGAAELPPSYQVDTAPVPVNAGSTAGSGSFAPGSQVTVTAVPNAGFRFSGWTENGELLGTALTYTFTLDLNHSISANFVPDVPQWDLTSTVSPADSGSVAGAGLVDDGASATLTATAAAGYRFVNWTEGGVVVSTATAYSFLATASRSLVANFIAVPTFTISAAALPVAGGTVTGSGIYNDGSSATLTAVPEPGYLFAKWTSGAAQVSTSPVYTFNVSQNRIFTANFVAAGEARNIAAVASPLTGGTISGTGTYATGDTATLTATPAPFYKFNRWRENGNNVSSSPVYSFTVTAGRNLSAQFIEAFVVECSSSPGAGGSTEMDSADYKTGESARAKAFPADGYSFLNWTENGNVVSTSDVYDFNITGNRVLVANFIADTGVTIATFASPVNGGGVTGDGAYNTGDDVILSATPAIGFVFSHWTAGGAQISLDPDYTFEADNNQTLVGHFVPAIAISAGNIPVGGGTVTGAGDYASGAIASLEAIASQDFVFRNWTENGVIVSTDALFSFTVTGPRELIANFAAAWTISASGWPASGGTVGGAGWVTPGSSITLVAAAAEEYSFAGWTDSQGNLVSTDPSYTFTPEASGVYLANFTPGLAGVHFTFDTGIPLLGLHTAVPFTQTVGGLTASFSSPDALPPTVETETSTGVILPKFAANYLAPSTGSGTTLVIQFDQPVSGVAFNFATTDDSSATVASDIQVTATDSAINTVVGTSMAHGTLQPAATYPTGTLTLNTGLSFDTLRIELASFPQGAQQLMIDNLIVSTTGSTGGSMLLENPDWNITLTDFGYSDYLLDNTPGFEGREYLSGEWGSAISYVKDGVPVSPVWLEPNFLFPDWQTNSNFRVVQGIHLAGTNADGLPVAESVLANDDVEITLHFEMLDTVTGTPMGLVATGSGGAGGAASSNRYVLNQTFRVHNISGVSITDVRLYQLMHGFISQRGVYDSRAYAGKLSDYHYDTTLAGLDSSSAGASSSSEGFEDYLTFHSKVAPSAFEIGHYGIDHQGSGDNHSTGKPSDGVHLSIEDDWSSAPFSARQGRDSFSPADRWIAGGQRWSVGNLAAGQTASLDIMLSLLTGTSVTTGGGGNELQGGSCNGGSSRVGGLDFEFPDGHNGGTFFGEYSEADDDELFERENEGEFTAPDFALPGGAVTQLWNLSFNGSYTGNIHLTFAYNAALLPPGFDESKLAIYHYNGVLWEKLTGTVNVVANTISVTTSSLSPFALGMISAGPGISIPNTTGGLVSGGGSYNMGDQVVLTADPADGWEFTGWLEGGQSAGTARSISFVYEGPRTITPEFLPVLVLDQSAGAAAQLSWPADATGWTLQESADLNNWTQSIREVTTGPLRKQVLLPAQGNRGFFKLTKP